MQYKKGVKRKKVIDPKKDKAVILTKKQAFIEHKKPLSPTPTTFVPKHVRVTHIATEGKKKRPK